MPTFVLYTMMCLKYIDRPCTVENLPWKKRDILPGPCLDNLTLREYQLLSSKHTLNVDETWLFIFDSYVIVIKVRFLYYMYGYGR